MQTAKRRFRLFPIVAALLTISTSTMMMLTTTGGMYMVRIESISQDEFSLGGKLGFTLRRGDCK